MTEDFDEFPALELGHRAGLADADLITDSSAAFFIVCVELLRTLHDFLKLRMRNTGDVFDNDGLIHGSGLDNANAHFGVLLLAAL